MSAPPRWLIPALWLWTVLAAVALANATSMRVTAGPVALVLALLAAGHGLIHHRWRVAGPFAALALVAGVVNGAPAVDSTYTGPAGSDAVKVIWAAALVVVSAEIAWGLLLHHRYQQKLADLDRWHGRARQAADQREDEAASIRRNLVASADYLDRVERHLTEVR